MSRLLLVRHGITEFNSTRRLAGHSDIEMNIDGYGQVERLRDYLVSEKIDAVYSSDLKRALITADIISSSCKASVVSCAELREMNYGEAEGLTFQEIGRLFPKVAEMIANYSLHLKFPGGESFEEFVGRINRFTEKLEIHAPSDTILIVAHSGPLKVLVCHLLGIDQSHWRQIRIDNASLSIVETSAGGVIINLLNGTYHLRNEK